MRSDERNHGIPGHGMPKSGNVEILRRTRAVQVMLSIPAARPVDRREVVGKGRSMLAREQARSARAVPEAATETPGERSAPRVVGTSTPGCGAWWAF